MLSTNDQSDMRYGYRYLAKRQISQFGMAVVVPHGRWRLSLKIQSAIPPPLNENNVEKSCHVFFKLICLSIFPEKLRKTTKKILDFPSLGWYTNS